MKSKWIFIICLLFLGIIYLKNLYLPEKINLLKSQYFNTLDDWALNDKSEKTFEDNIIFTCSNLTSISDKDINKKLKPFIDKYYDGKNSNFIYDMCVKTTFHRVTPQPEFQNSNFDFVCKDSENALVEKLCSKAGLL